MNAPLRVHALAIAAVGAISTAVVLGAPLVQPSPAATSVALILSAPSTPVTLTAYAQQRQTSTGPIAATNLADQSQAGRVISYSVVPPPVTDNATCELRWTQLAHRRDRPAEEGTWRYEAVLGWPDGLLVHPGAGQEKLTGEIWVPLPNPLVDVGRYVIRLQLHCGGSPIATADSAPFRVDVKQSGLRAETP